MKVVNNINSNTQFGMAFNLDRTANFALFKRAKNPYEYMKVERLIRSAEKIPVTANVSARKGKKTNRFYAVIFDKNNNQVLYAESILNSLFSSPSKFFKDLTKKANKIAQN